MIQKDDKSFIELFQAHPMPMWVYDLETYAFLAVNNAAVAHYGYSEAEFLRMTIKDIRPPEDLPRLYRNLAQAPLASIEKAGVWKHRKKDGSLIDVEITSHPLSFNNRACKFVLANDVTERRHQQDRIERLGRIYAVLSGVNAAIVRFRGRDELFQEVCRVSVRDGGFAFACIAAIDPETLDGRIVASFGGDPALVDRIRLTARDGVPESAWPGSTAAREMRTVICNDLLSEPSLARQRNDLEEHGYLALAALPLVAENRAVAVLGLCAGEKDFFDQDQLKLLNDLASDLSFAMLFMDQEERLSYLAYYDALTGLPNTKLFHDRTAQLIHAHGHDQGEVGVVVLNLARFARLNDALGRHAGDALLKQVAQRLGNAIRDTDSLARIGSDTFAVALADLRRDEDAAAILQQHVFSVFGEPFLLNGQDIRVSAKAGLALYPADGRDAETLLKHAEVALRNAKSSDERYLYYAPRMNATLAEKLMLENELQMALRARQFELHYQPRVDLQSGRIVSAEALIRWRHPKRGLLQSADFIPLAEETGLIVPIGSWVIDAVCAQQAAWLARQVDIVPVSINLSAAQCRKGRILQTIHDAASAHCLNAKHIEFELTETVVMEDPDEAAHYLHALKRSGARLSLDDFGTGYSSLAYLKRFPFDFVKIDRGFIAEVTRSPEDAAIATAVIAMAHSLKLRVVAEGVETEGQLRFLRRLRCDEIQGFLFSGPVPADAFEAMLAQGARLAPGKDPGKNGDTLLIVDDEPHLLSALNRVLRRGGYRILTATSGQEGLDLLATNAVQVIISDQRMPGMSGSEFLGIVKDLYPDTIRIILSGYTDLDVVTDSVNRGAVFKFLTKPWDDELLREHVRDAFRRYRPS
ncbi:MAG TPA: EAL domain-containing protein [Paucimonas sp.]|nr:EAL domain-containing protein [Paucimonas sp.]